MHGRQCKNLIWSSILNSRSSILGPARGLVVSVSAGRSRVWISAGSYQDLINWYCSLLTRRTEYRRATGNTIGLVRDGPRQVSLPKTRYSKWMKHQWKLYGTGAAILSAPTTLKRVMGQQQFLILKVNISISEKFKLLKTWPCKNFNWV